LRPAAAAASSVAAAGRHLHSLLMIVSAAVLAASVEPPFFESVWSSIDLGAGRVINLFASNGTGGVRS
jgi:hypothetical protein